MGVQGALALLTTVAATARAWSEMKDTLASEAMITAMPFIENASGPCQQVRVQIFLLLLGDRDEGGSLALPVISSPEIRNSYVWSVQVGGRIAHRVDQL